ncbi:hypothetical protein M8C21_017972 [Ambrosia artemisiifolia]|uniref:SPX domain-containing protein n=1 Tax=Ambrosia artemisiifolia TaxID=4212 RepID=A0AAD5G5N3_AMBAR|nr:hypothetical protein M8C21_017972 [Ambrosia artemisiifolia]
MEVIHEDQQEEEEDRSDRPREYQMASLDVLNRVKLNPTTDSPLSAVKSLFTSSKSDLQLNKNGLRDAKEKLKQAFIEFHEKLRYLKNYA